MLVIGSTNPELMKVYVQDFDDNYHRFDDEPSTELEKAARRIRRRYRNMSDYNDAMAIYNEYMAYMYLKHGGYQLFKLKRDWDMIDDFMPPKPGFKSNEFNKSIFKNKIVVSHQTSKDYNFDRVDKLLDAYDEDKHSEIVIDEMSNKHAKEMKDVIGRITFNKDEVKNKLRKLSKLDHLNEYWKERRNRYNKEMNDRRKYSDEDRVSLSDYYSGEYIDKIYDDEDEERITYQGRVFDRRSADQLALYRELSKLGWDSMQLMRQRNVSKGISKVFKNEQKNKKKKKKGRETKDDTMLQILTDGDYDSFEDFQAEMENFTSNNIF